MRKLVNSVRTKINEKRGLAAQKVYAKKPGSTGVIAAAILLVIAVLLLITFKGSISGWLSSVSSSISTKISSFTS